MLFKKLIFDNYKAYYGHQEINLTIPQVYRESHEKNIILIGGLNGSGKTTVLKAILYVLFGKRAISDAEHSRIFSNVLNNTFYDEGGRDCYVALVLQVENGEEWELKTQWSFDHNKKLINENRSIMVRKPGVVHFKQAKIDNIQVYNKLIDRIIPFDAAPFFIFDGEEIKDIILRQNSSEMKEAIQKIAGIEAYRALLEDLKGIQSKLEKSVAAAHKESDSPTQHQLAKVETEVTRLKEKKDKVQLQVAKIEESIAQVREMRAKKLAQNSRSREAVVRKQSQISAELKQLKSQFKEHFEHSAVHIILAAKIKKLQERLRLERDTRQRKQVYDAALLPFRRFLTELLECQVSPPLSDSQLNQIRRYGEEIWVKENGIKHNVGNEVSEIHDVSSAEYNYLVNLRLNGREGIIRLINRIDATQQEMSQTELELRSAPESQDIEEENGKLDILLKKLGEAEARLRSITNKLNSLVDEQASLRNKSTRSSERSGNLEDLNIQLTQVTRLVSSLTQYIDRITIIKAAFIRDEFSNMLGVLFRKQQEFGKIDFDMNSYTIKLYNDKNQEISIQDRSAGEMQMIASALIWALTKVSDLSLPVVIDTPLGRLDSVHRDRLINHYYKGLSEQVIILSTDTEITPDYVDLMNKHTYRQYRLDYDSEKKYTLVRDGYFSLIKG